MGYTLVSSQGVYLSLKLAKLLTPFGASINKRADYNSFCRKNQGNGRMGLVFKFPPNHKPKADQPYMIYVKEYRYTEPQRDRFGKKMISYLILKLIAIKGSTNLVLYYMEHEKIQEVTFETEPEFSMSAEGFFHSATIYGAHTDEKLSLKLWPPTSRSEFICEVALPLAPDSFSRTNVAYYQLEDHAKVYDRRGLNVRERFAFCEMENVDGHIQYNLWPFTGEEPSEPVQILTIQGLKSVTDLTEPSSSSEGSTIGDLVDFENIKRQLNNS